MAGHQAAACMISPSPSIAMIDEVAEGLPFDAADELAAALAPGGVVASAPVRSRRARAARRRSSGVMRGSYGQARRQTRTCAFGGASRPVGRPPPDVCVRAMRVLIALPLLLGLAACASAPKPSGQLSSYEGLERREGAVRTGLAVRKATQPAGRIVIEPTQVAEGPDTAWMTAAERAALAREADAQLCFELTERYELAPTPEEADARMRAVITRVKPTGRTASAFSAASGFFIPGPIGLRVPGTVGGLSAEAEMTDRAGRQLAAVVWTRDAQPIGTDNPSLSRLGDALQFVEPFAVAAAAAATPEGFKSRRIGDDGPCAAFGPRIRPEGFLAKFATGLYVPNLSGARPAAADEGATETR